jgi:hypothetical protein
MPSLRPGVVSLACLLALLFAFGSRSVGQTQQEGTTLVQLAPSGVALDRVDFKQYGPGEQDRTRSWGTKCVAFTNSSVRTIAIVMLNFSWKNGTREEDEPYISTSPVGPGVTVGLLKNGTAEGLCNSTTRGREIGASDAQLEVFVTGVAYEDGSVWSLVPPVDGSAVNAPGSPPATLAAVQTYWYAFPTVPSKFGVAQIPGPYACASIQNMSPKTIADVHIVYHHLSAEGVDLGDDTLEVKGEILPGAVARNNCQHFTAPARPVVRVFAEHGASGLGPLKVFYKGVPSTLSAQIAGVDFADHTSWKP